MKRKRTPFMAFLRHDYPEKARRLRRDRGMIEIEIKCLPGTDIDEACKISRRLAEKLEINISFNFNGVCMFVRPLSDIDELVLAYHSALKNQKNFATA